MNPAAVASLALALLASRVQGQDARLAARLDSATHAAVAAIVDSARAASLPTEPLIDKALEGASKQASGDRITAAVRVLAGQLRDARSALGARPSEAEIVAGAGALNAGIDSAVLSRIRQSRQRRPATVALATLSDLVALGVPADSASGAVLSLVRAGAEDSALIAFRRDVERDINAGVPPAAAVSVRARGGQKKP